MGVLHTELSNSGTEQIQILKKFLRYLASPTSSCLLSETAEPNRFVLRGHSYCFNISYNPLVKTSFWHPQSCLTCLVVPVVPCQGPSKTSLEKHPNLGLLMNSVQAFTIAAAILYYNYLFTCLFSLLDYELFRPNPIYHLPHLSFLSILASTESVSVE